MYEIPNFDPTLDMRVRFQGQPAVDTGGPRRQMFTSVFTTFATSTDLNLFEHDGQFLRPQYSVQNVMSNLMVILGKMIAHALALEGLGFPYLSCCSILQLRIRRKHFNTLDLMMLAHMCKSC